MTQSNFIRWSGLAAILVGLLGVAGQLTELMGNEQEWIYTVFDLVMLAALTGIFLFQRQEAGVLGTLGYIVAMAGNVISLFDFLLADVLWRIGGAIVGVGLILLAIGALKAGKLPRWAPIFWIISPVIGVPAIFWEAMSAPMTAGAIAFFAMGFIGAGYRLWTPAT